MMHSEKKLQESAWLYYLAHEATLRQICMKACRYDAMKADELMSDEVLERLPRIIELWNYNASRPLESYVNSTIRWYVWKACVIDARKRKRFVNTEHITEGVSLQHNDIDHDDAVQYLLEDCTDFERQLVILYYVHGYTFQELGEMTDLSRMKVSKIVREAIEKVRSAKADHLHG